MRPPNNSSTLLPRARQLRREDTLAEKKAWILLKDRRTLHLKFRRQVPIDRYIVDFYCHEIRLILELDGGVHDQPGQIEWDATRTARLLELKYKILRVPNDIVLKDPESFYEMIKMMYPSPGLRPPSPVGRGN